MRVGGKNFLIQGVPLILSRPVSVTLLFGTLEYLGLGIQDFLDFKVYIVKATVSGVFEDLKFKILEDSNQN